MDSQAVESWAEVCRARVSEMLRDGVQLMGLQGWDSRMYLGSRPGALGPAACGSLASPPIGRCFQCFWHLSLQTPAWGFEARPFEACFENHEAEYSSRPVGSISL